MKQNFKQGTPINSLDLLTMEEAGEPFTTKNGFTVKNLQEKEKLPVLLICLATIVLFLILSSLLVTIMMYKKTSKVQIEFKTSSREDVELTDINLN